MFFTEDELKRFDAKDIDVSGVTEKYKAEALQQLEFREKPTMTDEEVRAEYKRVEQNKKEEERNPLALADNNKATAMRLFKEGKTDKQVVTAIGDDSKAMMDKVREWKKEYEKEKPEEVKNPIQVKNGLGKMETLS